MRLEADRNITAEFGFPGPCESVQSGDWHTASTWNCGRVPNSGDDVVIRDGHVVNISAEDANALSLKLQDNGHLNMSASRNLNVYRFN